MDAATPTSCILCYEADELGSMVQVEFASRDGLRVTRVVLCRRCAAAISAALASVMADEDQDANNRNLERIVLVHNHGSAVDAEVPEVWGPNEDVKSDRKMQSVEEDEDEPNQ